MHAVDLADDKHPMMHERQLQRKGNNDILLCWLEGPVINGTTVDECGVIANSIIIAILVKMVNSKKMGFNNFVNPA